MLFVSQLDCILFPGGFKTTHNVRILNLKALQGGELFGLVVSTELCNKEE